MNNDQPIFIDTATAPKPVGPYSQAVETSNNLVFISGQIALIPGTDSMNMENEVEQVFTNLKAIEKATCSQIISLRVYLLNLEQIQEVNACITKHFSKPYPARASIQVSGLPKNATCEVEAVAVKKDV